MKRSFFMPLFLRSVFAWGLLLYVVLVTAQLFAKGKSTAIVPEIPYLNGYDLLFAHNWYTTGDHYVWISWLIVHGCMLTLWWRWK